jgi:hypothetical protein
METIGQSSLSTYLSDGWHKEGVTNEDIRRDRGYSVGSFSNLVCSVAQLAFYNRDHVLLFRGQGSEYRTSTKMLTSIQPSIFRSGGVEDWPTTLRARFRRLESADQRLKQLWFDHNLEDETRLVRQLILRWAILQHYEVCATPLLDVTHSLRIAASFASHAGAGVKAMLYVLAVPQLSGAITASAEANLQIVRLSSICPPSARRPHFQEGYLLGEYPEIQTVAQKDNYRLFEIDFGRRLLCKFRLQLRSFWSDDAFPCVPKKALYPDRRDPDDKLAIIAEEIKQDDSNA